MMHSSGIDHGAEGTLSHRDENLLNVCETMCLGTGARGRKQAIVFEGALFKTLAMSFVYIYFIYLLSFLFELILKTPQFFLAMIKSANWSYCNQ